MIKSEKLFRTASRTTGGKSSGKQQFGLNVGSSSILLIFVILCLISFATLSIVSANADRRLSEKVLHRAASYYQACNQAEQSLADLDRALIAAFEAAPGETEYFAAVGHTKSYAVPISDLQTLEVGIEILYPENDEDPFYTITSWQVINTGELDYSSTLPVPK